MNILLFLKPKDDITYVYDNFTIRQVLEKMEANRFTSIPVLNKNGEYVGSLTEGDILWAIKNMSNFDIHEAEKKKISELNRIRDNTPINVNEDMDNLIKIAVDQNFVPVVDDRNKFIGMVTRKDIIQYYLKKVESKQI